MSSRPSDARRWGPRRVAAWLLGLATENVQAAVYGTVVVGVLLGAEDAHDVGYAGTLEAAALVLALYWLTGLYAHDLGDRLQRSEQVNVRHILRSSLHELPIVEGGFIPVLALLIAWAAGASVTSGVRAAVWTTAVTIVALELAAGRRARLRPKRFSAQAAAGVAMGFAIVALNLLLH